MFAAIAGVTPSQSSLGNNIRHRLNLHTDQRLIQALDVIAKVRMNFHKDAKPFVEERRRMVSSYSETMRIDKRYLAHSILRALLVIMA